MFRYLADKQGLGGKYHLSSAGTSAYHVGEAPDRRMRQVAAEHGFEYTGKAKQFWREDLEENDLIIVMDQDNRRIIRAMAQDDHQLTKIRMMREFDPEGSGDLDVPDPYYGGVEGFEMTYQIVKRCCEGLLENLESDFPAP